MKKSLESPSPVARVQESMARAGKSYALWNALSTFPIWEGFRVSSVLLYEFLQKCPEKFPDVVGNLREEMLDRYRSHALDGLSVSNLAEREWRLMTLVQAASFVSSAVLLREKGILLMALQHIGQKAFPKELAARVKACEKFHFGKGGPTIAVCREVGYKPTIIDGKKAFVHPKSGDIVVLAGPKLKGGALFLPEENARRALLNEEKNAIAKAGRRIPKPKAAKKIEEKSKKKGRR